MPSPFPVVRPLQPAAEQVEGQEGQFTATRDMCTIRTDGLHQQSKRSYLSVFGERVLVFHCRVVRGGVCGVHGDSVV